MAKTETPSESSNAESSRAALDGRALNFSARAGLPPADLFDVGTGYGAKAGAGRPLAQGRARQQAPARPMAQQPQRPLAQPAVRHLAQPHEGEAALGGPAAFGSAAYGALPGPARARDRRPVEELPFVDAEDVIEEELEEEEQAPAGYVDSHADSAYSRVDYGAGAGRADQVAAFEDHGFEDHGGGRGDFAAQPANFGAPRAGAAGKLPMANLDPPSGARLDLTPSPVPRVALAPATGSVDVSLVPGPHTPGNRNLPTLAAHHLFGGRQRRPAAAVTQPPPADSRSGRVAHSRDRRLRSGFAKDVRSSKREIVLGLMIGLGLSMLLAAAGQAYLTEEVPVADAAPPQLESLTLSARPEAAPERELVGGHSANSPPAESDFAGDTGLTAPAEPGPRPAAAAVDGFLPEQRADNSRAGSFGAGRSSPAGGTAFGAGAGSAASEGPSRATPPRSVDRARRAARGNAAGVRKGQPMIAEELPAFEAGKSFDAPPSDRSSLSPAESAGLGLDLPL